MPTPGCKLFFLEMDIQVVMPACSITEIALQYTVMKIGKKSVIIPKKVIYHPSVPCDKKRIFFEIHFFNVVMQLISVIMRQELICYETYSCGKTYIRIACIACTYKEAACGYK